MYMEVSFVIAVALGVAIAVVLLVLIAVVVYQRWRISDNNAHLKAFIDENIDMREKLNQYELGMGARNSNNSKPAMKKSLRKDQREQQLEPGHDAKSCQPLSDFSGGAVPFFMFHTVILHLFQYSVNLADCDSEKNVL